MAAQEGGAKRRSIFCVGIFKSMVSEFTEASPSAKSNYSHTEHLMPLREVTSEFISSACQSVKDKGQKANHSPPGLLAEPAQHTRRGGESACLESIRNLEGIRKKPQLNLPPAADRRWAQLDEDLSTTLDNILEGDAAKKIKTMVQIMYQACQDTFGIKEGRTAKTPAGPQGGSARSQKCGERSEQSGKGVRKQTKREEKP